MKIKKLFKYYILGESLKDIEMGRILGKVSKNTKLSKRERDFLDLYNETQKSVFQNVQEDKDWMFVSRSFVSSKIKDLINLNKKVICDLHDRDGKIGLQILDIVDDGNGETSTILMKNNEKHKLDDKFLYNLIFNFKKDQYSLIEQDEYYEKIEVRND